MRAREQGSWEIRKGDVSIKTRAAEGASCAKNGGGGGGGKHCRQSEQLMQGGAWCVCISEMRPVGVDWGAGGGGER